jgi:hypothetical protein
MLSSAHSPTLSDRKGTIMRSSVLILTAASLGAASFATAQTPTSPPTEQVAANPADPDQRIRCRQITITGSLVRRERVCKTVAEWRRLRILANENARDIVDHSRTRAGGQ